MYACVWLPMVTTETATPKAPRPTAPPPATERISMISLATTFMFLDVMLALVPTNAFTPEAGGLVASKAVAVLLVPIAEVAASLLAAVFVETSPELPVVWVKLDRLENEREVWSELAM